VLKSLRNCESGSGDGKIRLNTPLSSFERLDDEVTLKRAIFA